MAAIPLSWNDPLFSNNISSGAVTLQNGGTVSNRSITDTGSLASVVGNGSFTMDDVRIDSREGVRIGGSGNINISNSYIETTGTGSDHADGIQAYAPGGTGNVTITNTAIVSHNSAATAGMFVADDYSGTFTFNNVMFEGGPYGLRICADKDDIYVSLTDVYFVGPFMYSPLLFQEVNAPIHITHWENVRYATIVNGELVPGALIPAPLPVEGGSTSTGSNAPAVPVPVIASFSTDSGVAGDRVTNDNSLELKGTAAAGSTVKIYDGSAQIGTTTANSTGAWTYTTAALSDAKHTLTATATNSSGKTSAASSALAVTVDTKAPAAPTVASNTVNSAKQVVLSGNAEANSTIKVYDGTTQVGTATTNSSGVWTVTTSALSTGSHAITAKATDAAGNTSAASSAVNPVIGSSSSSSVAAPVIASFSTDTGVVGDGITSDNTLQLKGTAAANSTVKVYDGTTQIGTTTAGSTGSWEYITSVLTNAKHMLTATATTSSGQTSTASAALAVTVDTAAPSAPVLVSDSVVNTNQVLLSGTAEANSKITVYDGTTKVGTGTANASGSWSVTTSALSTGSHALKATATDAAGNVSTMSLAADPVIGTTSPLAAPKIVSFSNDSGKAGDKITSDNTLTLAGTALAGSTVNVFDGATKVGTAAVNSAGQWSLTTPMLSDGTHNLTATDTVSSGQTSAASAAFSVTIDTHAPGAPTIAAYSQTGAAIGNTTAATDLVLKGTAEANSTINVFDAGKQIGTATTSSSGTWSFDTGNLASGNHSFTAKAVDVAGNVSSSSTADGVTVSAGTGTGFDLTNLRYNNWSHTATINGTADAYSQVRLYDGTTPLGSVKAAADGSWSFTTSYLSNRTHTFSAKEVDSTGHVVATSSGQAIVGSTRSNTLKSTSGDDIFVGNGHPDTFVFAANFGNDVIKDFVSSGRGHDTLQFSRTTFDSFASVLSHASQVGQDVVISTGHDTLTLKNTKLGALDSHDFHFA